MSSVAAVMSKDRVPNPAIPTTAIGIFKRILKTEGPLGLYRGIAPNFMKVRIHLCDVSLSRMGRVRN